MNARDPTRKPPGPEGHLKRTALFLARVAAITLAYLGLVSILLYPAIPAAGPI